MLRLLPLLVIAAAVLGACGGDDGDDEGATVTTGAQKVEFPSGCTTGLAEEPSSIVVTCGDAGFQLEDVGWSAWGGETATGTGSALVNDCDPDCASGTAKTYEQVEVELSKIRDCKAGRQYTRLGVSFAGERPKGYEQSLHVPFPCSLTAPS